MKKNKQKVQRQRRVRGKVQGTAETPRLSVFRSNKYIYAQLIDDVAGKTVLGVAGKPEGKDKSMPTQQAKALGVEIAKKALVKKIQKATFDRGHYKYHGRVKAVAEGAREGGLQF